MGIGDTFSKLFLGRKRKEVPGGLWMSCEGCKKLVYKQKVEDGGKVCPECNYHFTLSAQERINLLLDDKSFKEMHASMSSKDPLVFKGGNGNYKDKLKAAQEKLGMKSACVCGKGKVLGRDVMIAITDSRFMMGSMGSVVGEKIARTFEQAIKEKLPVIVVSGSGGGARMQEGAVSLMQMAKTSAAIAKHHDAGLLFISVLTHPTMGGALASFASLGDIIIAEPNALIGFSGERVIRTVKTTLPEGFQRSEFLAERGFVDRVVLRKEMRREIISILGYFGENFSEEDWKRLDTEEAARRGDTKIINKTEVAAAVAQKAGDSKKKSAKSAAKEEKAEAISSEKKEKESDGKSRIKESETVENITEDPANGNGVNGNGHKHIDPELLEPGSLVNNSEGQN